MTMFQIIFLGTNSTCSFASWNLLTGGIEVSFGSWSAVLLKASEILHDDAFLLCCNRSGPCLSHQIEHPFAILIFARMIRFFVLRKVFLIDEICIAQLAHQGSTQERFVGEGTQGFALYLTSWNVGAWSRWRILDLQDASFVFVGEVGVLRSRVVNEVLVLLQAPQQRPGALSAGKDEQVLIQPIFGYICETFHWVWRCLGFLNKLC